MEQGDEGEEECKPIRLGKNQRVLTLAWQNLMSPSGNAEALMALFCLKGLIEDCVFVPVVHPFVGFDFHDVSQCDGKLGPSHPPWLW